MFTFITLSGTPSPTLIANFANGGVQITGNTSGATAWVVNNIATTTGTRLVCIKQAGKFTSGEKIIRSIHGNLILSTLYVKPRYNISNKIH